MPMEAVSKGKLPVESKAVEAVPESPSQSTSNWKAPEKSLPSIEAVVTPRNAVAHESMVATPKPPASPKAGRKKKELPLSPDRSPAVTPRSRRKKASSGKKSKGSQIEDDSIHSSQEEGPSRLKDSVSFPHAKTRATHPLSV